MTDHTEIQDKLFAYLDLELAEAEQREVEGHLSACETCARELETTRRARTLFQSVPLHPLPDGFMSRLRSRLAEEDASASATPVPAAPPANRPLSVVPPAAPIQASSALPKTSVASFPVPSEARAQRRGRSAFVAMLAAMLLGIVGLTVMLRASSTSEDPALAPAALAYSEGEVRLQRGAVSSLVSQTTALRVGDIVQTAPESHAVMTLGNNGSARLAPASQLRVVALATSVDSGRLEVTLELVDGSVWIEDASGVQCALQAGGSRLKSAGAAFLASLRDDVARIDIWNGQALLEPQSAGFSPASLNAGQQAMVKRGAGPRLGDIDLREALSSAFVLWNLYLERPSRPTHAGPLLRPSFLQTVNAPTWVRAQIPPLPPPRN